VRSLHAAAAATFAPGKTVLVADRADAYVPPAVVPMRTSKEAKAGPVAFVCQGNTCSPPTSQPDRLRKLLAAPAPQVA
jgi:uncharacterized protein YyaL (SSP411 family)